MLQVSLHRNFPLTEGQRWRKRISLSETRNRFFWDCKDGSPRFGGFLEHPSVTVCVQQKIHLSVVSRPSGGDCVVYSRNPVSLG